MLRSAFRLRPESGRTVALQPVRVLTPTGRPGRETARGAGGSPTFFYYTATLTDFSSARVTDEIRKVPICRRRVINNVRIYGVYIYVFNDRAMSSDTPSTARVA